MAEAHLHNASITAFFHAFRNFVANWSVSRRVGADVSISTWDRVDRVAWYRLISFTPKALCQEDFHCSIALRNYERAWCAGTAGMGPGQGWEDGALSDYRWMTNGPGAVSEKMLSGHHQWSRPSNWIRTWFLFPRSLAKKKFCCKKEGIACKARCLERI